MGSSGDGAFDDLHRPTSGPTGQGAHRSFQLRPGPPATPRSTGSAQFQLARDSNFGAIVISTQVSEPQLTIPRPESGFHYLRMRVIEADGYLGPFGPVQRIEVPPASYWQYGMVLLLTLVLVL